MSGVIHTSPVDGGNNTPSESSSESSVTSFGALRSMSVERSMRGNHMFADVQVETLTDRVIENAVRRESTSFWFGEHMESGEVEKSVTNESDLRKSVMIMQEHRRKSMSEKRSKSGDMNIILSEAERGLLIEEDRVESKIKQWHRFDLCFGLIVVANGVMLGLGMNNVYDQSELWSFCVENGFATAFIIEFIVRWCYSGEKLFAFLQKGWIIFDFAVIIICVIDIWVLKLIDVSSDAGGIGVLRVVRMLRLIRLMRLGRLFEHLWIVVMAMAGSVQTIAWILFCLMVVSWCFSLVLSECLHEEDGFDDGYFEIYWGTVGRGMLTFLQIATGDGAVEIMKDMILTYHKSWTVFVFFAFLGLAKLGILNMCIGPQLTCALEISNHDLYSMSTRNAVLYHETLQKLSDRIAENCRLSQLTDEKGQPVVTRATLLAWLMEEEKWTDMEEKDSSPFRNAELTKEDIDMIFNEIGSASATGHNVISLKSFIKSCFWAKKQVRTGHMLTVIAKIRAFHHKIICMNFTLDQMVTVLDDASSKMNPYLHLFHKPHEKHYVKNDADENIPEDSSEAPKFKSSDVHLGAMRQKLENDKQKIRAEMKFDIFWLCIVTFNVVFLTIRPEFDLETTTTRDTINVLLCYGLHCSFLFAFTIEIILRIIMKYQFDSDSTDMWFCFPMTMWHLNMAMFPKVVGVLPNMIRDKFFVLDLTLVLGKAVDVIIVWFVGPDTGPLAHLVFARVLRLGRVLEFSHTLRRFHKLDTVVNVFLVAAPVLGWCLCMTLVILYMAAIIMVTTLSQQNNPPEITERWNHILTSMMTFGQLAVFSDWGRRTEEVGSLHPWTYGFILFFNGFVGLAMTNLVIGVVVQAAFRRLSDEKKSAASIRMKSIRDEFSEAFDESEGLDVEGVHSLLMDVTFMSKLRKSNIRADQIVRVFQKLNLTGRVEVKDFVDALGLLVKSVQGIHVVDVKSHMRRLRVESELCAKDVSICNECFMQVIEQLRSITLLKDTQASSSLNKVVDGRGVDSGKEIMKQAARIQRENTELKKKN